MNICGVPYPVYMCCSILPYAKQTHFNDHILGARYGVLDYDTINVERREVYCSAGTSRGAAPRTGTGLGGAGIVQLFASTRNEVSEKKQPQQQHWISCDSCHMSQPRHAVSQCQGHATVQRNTARGNCAAQCNGAASLLPSGKYPLRQQRASEGGSSDYAVPSYYPARAHTYFYDFKCTD